ncbi:3-deoxy-D-manno-octulosonic acid kinase [Castellaniella sp.]|uniref:3-deoxy-D-manno-octulosonic acid kinase n=1 Tax=Castellaniella sp. TaxID=1955812 RepID=UPI0035661503
MNPLPAGWTLLAFGSQQLAVPDRLAPLAEAGWMSATRPDAQPVTAGGRQAAWFVDGPHGPAVLRHYRRGGLRAHLGRTHYCWLGLARVRALAEVRVLAHLRQSGVPVPEPLAAAYWRTGPWYRNAILVRRIPSARPLVHCLDVAQPQRVAGALRAMHAAGVWHADLNAWNIVLDGNQQVWLIDFDRARLGVVSRKQAQKNWLRLRRSLVKVAGLRGAQWWDGLSLCLPRS